MRAKGKGFNPNSPDFAPMIASVAPRQRHSGHGLRSVRRGEAETWKTLCRQRPDDASAHFYLAKLERLTARTPEERQDALNHLTTALKLDADRGAIPSAHLEYAVALMEQGDPANQGQISSELKAYVALSPSAITPDCRRTCP